MLPDDWDRIAQVATFVAAVGLAVALLLVAFRANSISSRPGAALGQPGFAFLVVPILALVVVATLAVWLEGGGIGQGEIREEVRLPILLAGGVLILLLALATTSVVFKQIGLGNANEELGLPPGSIRAVIALALILIFAIMVLFLFSRSVAPVTVTLANLTQAEVDSIPVVERFRVDPVLGSTPPVFRVTRVLTDLTDDRQALANQIVTILGTLVTAISAFYFGANSVSAAQHAISATPPQIRVAGGPKQQLSRVNNDLAPVDILVLTTPGGLEVIHSVNPASAGTLVPVGPERYRFTPGPPPNLPATLHFALATRPDIVAEVHVEAPSP